jgi:hypothetical protein
MTRRTEPRRPFARSIAIGGLAIALALPASLPLSAQGPVRSDRPAAPGWVFTPAISVAESWDTNVLLATEGNERTGDFLTAITPRGALGYRGRRTTFHLDYRGAYQLYQELTELNAFDQRANAAYTFRISPTVSIFARNGLSKSPTTDDIDVPGVRFRRQGVLLNDMRSGVEARLNRRTTATAAYAFQWVEFDEEDVMVTVDGLRRGGHAHGGSGQVDYLLMPRVTLGGEFDMRHATVDETREFDVQNMLATVGWRLSERMELSGGAGYAWLATSQTGERHGAPAFRVSLTGSGRQLAWNVGYRRSFLPSFGFGGTFQNQEFNAGVLAPLTRRVDLSGSLAVRENDPLAAADQLAPENLGLRSVYLRSSVSYLATRWMRIEGYYTAAFQNSQRPGGEVNRSRAGVQVVTSTRMRIR